MYSRKKLPHRKRRRAAAVRAAADAAVRPEISRRRQNKPNQKARLKSLAFFVGCQLKQKNFRRLSEQTGSVNQPNRLFSLSHKRFVECSSLDGSLRQSKGKYIENRQVVYAGLRCELQARKCPWGMSETFARTKVSDSNPSGSRNFHVPMKPYHFAHTQV